MHLRQPSHTSTAETYRCVKKYNSTISFIFIFLYWVDWKICVHSYTYNTLLTLKNMNETTIKIFFSLNCANKIKFWWLPYWHIKITHKNFSQSFLPSLFFTCREQSSMSIIIYVRDIKSVIFLENSYLQEFSISEIQKVPT